jgi:chromosome segregation ATPase
MATVSPSLQLRRLQQEAKAKELGQQLDNLKSRIEVRNEDDLSTELDVLLRQLEIKDSRIGSLESELEKKSVKIQELVLQMEVFGQELDGSYQDTLKALQNADLAVAADRKQLEQKLSHMEALLSQSKLVTEMSAPNGSNYLTTELQGQLPMSSNVTDFLQEHLSHAEEEKRSVIEEKVRLESHIMELMQVQKIRDDKIALLEKKNLDQATQIIQLATQLADLRQSKNHATGISSDSEEEGYIEHLRFLARSAEEERDVLAQRLKEKETALNDAMASLEETKRNIDRLELSVQEQAAAKDQLSQELDMLQSTLATKESELQSMESVALSSKSAISSLTSDVTSLQSHLKTTEDKLTQTSSAYAFAQKELAVKQTALANLESNLHALEEQVKQKESELRASVVHANSLTQTLDQRNMRIQQIEEKAACVSKQAQDSAGALDEVRSAKQIAEENVVLLERTIDDIKAQLAESCADLDRAQIEREEEREQLKAQIQDLIEQLSEKGAELQASENVLDDLRKQHEKTLKMKEDLETELSEHKSQLDELKGRSDKAFREAEVERLKLVNQIAELESRLAEIDQIAGLAKVALEKALDDKEASEAKVEDLQKKLAEASAATTQSSDDGTSGIIQDLQSKLEASQQEAIVLKENSQQAQQALESAEEKSLELEYQLSQLNEVFQQSELENEAPALQAELDALENEVAELKASLLSAEEKCFLQEEALKKAVEDSELQGGAVKVSENQMFDLQKQLDDFESQPDIAADVRCALESRISELTNLLAGMETDLAFSRTEYAALQNRLEQAQQMEQSLSYQLGASRSELEKYIAEHVKEAEIYRERGEQCVKLQAEVESFQLRVATLETTLAEIKSDSSSPQNRINAMEEEKQKMEAYLKKQIHDLDSRLLDSTKEVQLLRVNLNQSLELRSTHASRLEELTNQLGMFHSQLLEKDQVIAAKDKSIGEHAAKMEELIAHIAEVEGQLTESDKITKFSRTCSSRLEEEKRISEARSQRKIVEMETQLAENGRKVETLQTTLSSVEDEKRELKEKRKDLEAKMNNLTMLLRFKEEEIEAKDRSSRDHVMKVDDLMRQLAEVEGRLQVSNQVAEFLQSCLSKADEENRLNESKWQKKIGQLEIAIAETKRKSEMAVLRAEEEKRLSESKAKDLVMSVERSVQKFLASHAQTDIVAPPTMDIVTPLANPPKQKRQEIFLAGVIPLAILAVGAGVSLPCMRPPVPSSVSPSIPAKAVPLKRVTVSPESNAWQNKTPTIGVTSSNDCLETVSTFFRTVAVKEPVAVKDDPPVLEPTPKSSFWSGSSAESVEKVSAKHVGQIHRAVTDLLSDSLMANQFN